MSPSATCPAALPMDDPVACSIGRAPAVYLWVMAQARTDTDSHADGAADRRDVALAQGGDGGAYARLVARHQGEVARRMWRFTRDPAQQRELVQDVFVNAYMGLKGYRGDAPFVHWLRKIAVRTGYAFWRESEKCRREQSVAPEAMARFAEDPADRSAAEAAETVHCVLAQLPPRDRAVLTLLYLEERTVAEAADLLGWSRSMVKVQAWRARAKIRKLLGDYAP